MKIHWFVGLVVVCLVLSSQAQLLSPSRREMREQTAKTDVDLQRLNIMLAHTNQIIAFKQQLSALEHQRLTLLHHLRANNPKVHGVEFRIRRLRAELTREFSRPMDEVSLLNRIITQKEEQRRVLIRKPKTPDDQEQLAFLDAQLSAARSMKKRPRARPTPTPKVQLLSAHA